MVFLLSLIIIILSSINSNVFAQTPQPPTTDPTQISPSDSNSPDASVVTNNASIFYPLRAVPLGPILILVPFMLLNIRMILELRPRVVITTLTAMKSILVSAILGLVL